MQKSGLHTAFIYKKNIGRWDENPRGKVTKVGGTGEGEGKKPDLGKLLKTNKDFQNEYDQRATKTLETSK